MRILVTGAGGQLGYDIMKELSLRGHEVIGTELSAPASSGKGDIPGGSGSELVRMDITDRDQVIAVMGQTRPEAVIHCAAWTAVDLAEEPENRERYLPSTLRGPGTSQRQRRLSVL